MVFVFSPNSSHATTKLNRSVMIRYIDISIRRNVWPGSRSSLLHSLGKCPSYSSGWSLCGPQGHFFDMMQRNYFHCHCNLFHGAIILEKVIVPQPVKKSRAFYVTPRFITAFTRARQWSLSQSR